MKPNRLLKEFELLPHDARVRRMVELGRLAKSDAVSGCHDHIIRARRLLRALAGAQFLLRQPRWRAGAAGAGRPIAGDSRRGAAAGRAVPATTRR